MTTLRQPTAAEMEQARDALEHLPELRLSDLPAGVQEAVREVLAETAQGHAVRVLPVGAELTTQEAADVLGISRPTMARLLDQGRLPSWKVGTHRRVRLGDVATFRATQEAEQLAAMQELTELDEEMGLL